MIVPLASVRGSIADYVAALFIVYFVLCFIRVLLFWVPRLPYNLWLRRVVTFVEEACDPYLNLFRRFLPPVGGGSFSLDLSPTIALLLLYFGGGIVVGLIRG